MHVRDEQSVHVLKHKVCTKTARHTLPRGSSLWPIGRNMIGLASLWQSARAPGHSQPSAETALRSDSTVVRLFIPPRPRVEEDKVGRRSCTQSHAHTKGEPSWGAARGELKTYGKMFSTPFCSTRTTPSYLRMWVMSTLFVVAMNSAVLAHFVCCGGNQWDNA